MEKPLVLGLFFLGVLSSIHAASGQVKDSSAVPYILQEILVVPRDSIADRWKAQVLSKWEGRLATKENLEAIISDLLHYYSDNGFPFAEITPRVEETGAGKARLQLSLVAGPAVFISQILGRGFSSGEQRQLARILAFYPAAFDEREVEKWKNRVRQFPDLVWNGEPKLIGAPDFSSTRMDLPLARRVGNRVAGSLGYAPSGSGNGTFGNLSVQLVTLGKIGRSASFDWTRPNSQTRSLALAYRDFFLVPAPFYVSGRLGQEEKDGRYFRFGFVCGVSVPAARGWQGNLDFSHDRITPRVSPSSLAVESDRAAARQYGFKIGVQKGGESEPEEGYFLFKIGLDYKKVFHGSQVTSGAPKGTRLEAAKNFRLGSRWSVFAKAAGEAKWVASFLFTRSDLFYLGGFRTLRGYLDESLPATRYFSGQAEPRFHVGSQDYLFGFLDFALLSIGENPAGLPVSDVFKPGAGLGISAGRDKLVLALGWGEKAHLKDGIVYLRLSGGL